MQFGLEHSVCFQNSIYCDVKFIIKSEVQHYGIWWKLVLETFFLFTYLRTVFFIFFPLFQFIGSKVTDQKADEVSKLGILDFWTQIIIIDGLALDTVVICPEVWNQLIAHVFFCAV